MGKINWRIIRITLGIILITLLGSSIIFDLIYYFSGGPIHIILRIIIIYLLLEALLRLTWFGKELEKFIKDKLKKSKKKK